MAETGAEAVSSSSVLFVLMTSSSSRLLKRSLLEGKFNGSTLATGGLEILKVLKRLEDRSSSWLLLFLPPEEHGEERVLLFLVTDRGSFSSCTCSCLPKEGKEGGRSRQ